MKTRIVKIFDLQRDHAKIELAAHILGNGGLVALPTETVYGIAANALDPVAVASIFKAKGRPQDNPLIVHVSGFADIMPLVTDFPRQAQALADSFWPGPLTIILPKSDKIPDIVSAKLPTVAIRMPSHPIMRAVIEQSGLPLAAPSANLSGKPSPTSAAHCADDLSGKVDLIIDGGECSVGLESTVITLATNPPRLLRPGAVTLESLRSVLGNVEADRSITSEIDAAAQVSSPGMKYKHYAPKAKITVIHGSFNDFARYVGKKPGAVAALVFDGEEKRLAIPCVTYGARDNPGEQARRLFAALRELDKTGAGVVLARAPGKEGLGLAVYNRLIRAAAFDEIFL